MAQLRQLISQLLNSPGKVVTADDLSRYQSDVEKLIELKVMIEATPALSVVCDACGIGHVEEIYRVKRNDSYVYRIPCPESGWVDVSKERVSQWVLSFEGLAHELAASLPNSTKARPLLSGTAWHLGGIEISGASYAIVLTQANAVDAIASMLQPSRTVLVIGDRPADFPDFAVAIGFLDVVEWREGQLRVRLDKVRIDLGIDSVGENEFRRSGEGWIVRFRDESKVLIHSRGLFYIRQLLAQPKVQVPAVQLLARSSS